MTRTRFPVFLYDNTCHACTIYAKFLDKLMDENMMIIGHYTPEGIVTSLNSFPPGYNCTKQSWFITEEKCYGGRDNIIPLFKNIFAPSKKFPKNKFDDSICTNTCKNHSFRKKTRKYLTQGEIITRSNSMNNKDKS